MALEARMRQHLEMSALVSRSPVTYLQGNSDEEIIQDAKLHSALKE